MDLYLSLPTLMLCASVINMLNIMFISAAWYRTRRSVAIRYWAMAVWIAVFAAGAASLIQYVPTFVSQYGATSLYVTSSALVWAGYRAFFGQKTKTWQILLPFLIALPINLFAPSVEMLVAGSILFVFSLAATYLFMTGLVLLKGRKNEVLPSQKAGATIFFSHALTHLSAIPLVYFFPVELENMHPSSTWLFVVIMLLVLHTIATAFITTILAKERAELRFRVLAETDMLTGLSNRRSFVSAVERSLKETDTGGALAIIDLDHFKQVNDQYGHLAGDAVLTAFGKVLLEMAGQTHISGRFGGEEFSIYMPDVSATEGLVVARAVCERAARTVVKSGDQEIKFTISVGVAHRPDGVNSLDTLIAAADSALYLAKAQGRNRVRAADSALREILSDSDQDINWRVDIA